MADNKRHGDPVHILWTEGVAAWRELMGLTQVELAARLDVSRRTVQYWEELTPRKVPLTARLAIAARTLCPNLPEK